ncbi:MAG: deoxyribonuclease IV [Chthonomonas sp.]|nr:deoxyribonuclease IV [Chthonomonas sp.]
MSAQLLGAHVPTAGGLVTAFDRAEAIGCTAVQVFTTSPRQWAARPLTDEVLQKWHARKAVSPIQAYVSHDSYLVDLSSEIPENQEKSINFLVGELTRCALLEIPYCVSHMGSGRDAAPALATIAENTRRVLGETPDSVMLLMETTAGQGRDLGYRFEHWALVMELLGNPARLGICLDTCHIFAAGYDIRTPETYEASMAEFERLLGFDKLKCVHCNDSKKKYGSRVDRHEAIGDGEIGPEAFRCLVNDPRLEQTMIVLETPDAETMHGVNLQRLRDLRA